MNIGLLSILHNKKWDFHPGMAQTYATALKNAIELHLDNDIEKKHGFFLSKKGCQKDGQTIGADFSERLLYSDIHVGFDKTYVGNIESIERHLYWNDEQLQDDDEIINVVVVDGPITRDGGGCSYGSKDWRDQVMYANTIPQVVGHLFVVNTPGGESAARNDYDMMIADCREKGKPTVTFVDGGCYSSGVNLACRTDYVIVMNPKDGFGCIGSMVAFWAVAHDTVDQDGYRYVELVGKDCPEKNAWWREAAKGEYEELQADLDKDTEEFQQTVRENRPLVTDDMLSGKVFEAQEVIPALVDEIGNMDRAIECIFALANKEMQPARFMTAPEPEEKPGEQPEPDNKPEESTHQINNDMTEEEMKAAEAEAAKAAAQALDEQSETLATEETQEAAEQPEAQEKAPKAEEAPANEEQQAAEEAPATEEAPAEEEEKPAEEAPAEETPAEEEEQTAEEAPAEDVNTDKGNDTEGAPASEESADYSPSGKYVVKAEETIDRISETLHSAEQMIADKDKEIEDLKEQLAGTQKSLDEKLAEDLKVIEDKDKVIAEHVATITERDATIAGLKEDVDKLKKQVADLKAEVKELSGKETPMVDAAAGVPAGNGTGAAPQPYQKEITRDNMSYEHVQEVKKARAAAKKKN